MDSENLSNDVYLNEFFHAMSESDQEESDWKFHIQFLVSKVKSLSHLTKQDTKTPVELDVFGSAAEDLKCCLKNDIGDIDVMAYPIAEEAIIDDSVIEYCDDNPIYVRLRGEHHPVFQQCLVENSEFVAASSLKEFHPKLFGENKALMLNLIPKMFALFENVDPDNIVTRVANQPNRPSCQLDLAHTFGSLTEQINEQNQAQVLEEATRSEDLRNLLEWFAVTLNPSRDFTKEHSSCIDEYLTVVQQEAQSLKGNSSAQTYFDTLNKLMSSQQLHDLRQKVQNIDQRQKAESSSYSTMPDNEKNGNLVDPKDELADAKTDFRGSGIPFHSSTYEEATTSITTKSESPRKAGQPKNVEKQQSNEECVQDLQEESTSHSKMEKQPIIMQENLSQELIIEYLLRDFASLATKKTGKLEPHTKDYIHSGADLVPALKGKGWPAIAAAWPTRAGRAWPSQNAIANILENGFHVVVKSPQRTTHEDQIFRLSFSRSELILSGELNTVQRECYRCFKIFYRSVILERELKIIGSYLLKTILFWSVEETDVELWNEANRASCVLFLLKKLYKSLESKFLPHYFVPQCNLLEEAVAEHPQEVQYLACEFRKIYENPTEYPNGEEDNTSKEKAISTKKPQPSSEGNSRKESTASNKDEAASQTEVRSGSGSQLFLKYADFLKIYNEICVELIELALQEGNTSCTDPTVTEIVDNLKAVAGKMENQKAGLETILNHSQQLIYTMYVTHSGNTPRQKILSAVRGESKMFAYVAAQDDILAEGNEQLIINRMMNSDSFDLSSLVPGCGGLIRQIVGIADNLSTTSTNDGIEEDIPLD